MRILIVGGAGYVGSALIPALVERGYAVDVVDLKWFGVNLPREVSVVDKDILSLTTDDVGGYEQVIFLAGLSNDPMAEFDPAQNFQSNGAMPSYLAYLAKQVGVRRVIYASSCSVYGYTVNELYDENAPAVSSFPYGISKLQGEQGVLQMQDEGFSAIALRKGTICGFSPRMRFDLIVNTMYKTLYPGRQDHRQQSVAVATDSRHTGCRVRVSASHPGRLLDQRDLQHRIRQLHRRTGG